MEKNNNKRKRRLLYLLPIIFIIVGINFSKDSVMILLSGEKTIGTVIDVRVYKEINNEWNTYNMYSPIIEYTCWWQTNTQSPGYSSSRKYEVGQSVTVFCDPNDYSQIITYESLYILSFPLVGIIMLLILIYTFKREEKKKGIANLENKQTKSKTSKNLLQKNISEIEIFKKFHSVKIDNTLWTAIIALFASVGIWYMFYNFLFCDGEKEISWAIFLWIFELVFIYLFIIKAADYIRTITAKFKIRRWDLTIIQATVIWFQHTADALDSSYYKIICTNGLSEFYSEETEWKIYWFDDIPLNYLEALKIMYNPKNPKNTLQELDSHPKRLWIPDQYEETSQRLTKQIAAWEDYEHPYWIFNGKKITVWDSINVYIDPDNRKSYLVDLSFLK